MDLQITDTAKANHTKKGNLCLTISDNEKYIFNKINDEITPAVFALKSGDVIKNIKVIDINNGLFLVEEANINGLIYNNVREQNKLQPTVSKPIEQKQRKQFDESDPRYKENVSTRFKLLELSVNYYNKDKTDNLETILNNFSQYIKYGRFNK